MQRWAKQHTVQGGTYYIRDAQGNIMSTYRLQNDTLWADEFHIYGSSRLGITTIESIYWVESVASKPDVSDFKHCLGCKRYEIANHLGNVMTTINDRKTPVPLSAPFEDVAEYFMPTILMEMDYFPFGMQLFEPGTSYVDYRFGFNKQEKVDEIKGAGNHYTAKYWEYDPCVVQRWNVDPKANPAMSPYAILGGNPIWYTDFMGDITHPMASASTRIPHSLKTVYWDSTIGAALNFFGKIATGGVMYFCSTCGGEETRNAKDGGNVEYGPNIDNVLTIPESKDDKTNSYFRGAHYAAERINNSNANIPSPITTTNNHRLVEDVFNDNFPEPNEIDTIIDPSGQIWQRDHTIKRDGSGVPLHKRKTPLNQ